MTTVAFIGTFDPLHGGHIGQLLRAYESTKFSKALILVDKNVAHKPHASSWQHRVEMAKLTLGACTLPFEYEVHAVENSTATEFRTQANYKIIGIDSLIDDLADETRWHFATRWSMIVLSIPGIDDSLIEATLAQTSKEVREAIRYILVSEKEVPMMNYDFSTNKPSSERVHSTHLRAGTSTAFIPLSTQKYISNHQLY